MLTKDSQTALHTEHPFLARLASGFTKFVVHRCHSFHFCGAVFVKEHRVRAALGKESQQPSMTAGQHGQGLTAPSSPIEIRY